MLPSYGYFRSFLCPFSDDCHRPFCQYKHVRENNVRQDDESNFNGAENDCLELDGNEFLQYLGPCYTRIKKERKPVKAGKKKEPESSKATHSEKSGKHKTDSSKSNRNSPSKRSSSISSHKSRSNHKKRHKSDRKDNKKREKTKTVEKVVENPQGKGVENSEEKVVENSKVKAVENSEEKVVENSETKAAENPEQRVVENSKEKLPQKPSSSNIPEIKKTDLDIADIEKILEGGFSSDEDTSEPTTPVEISPIPAISDEKIATIGEEVPEYNGKRRIAHKTNIPLCHDLLRRTFGVKRPLPKNKIKPVAMSPLLSTVIEACKKDPEDYPLAKKRRIAHVPNHNNMKNSTPPAAFHPKQSTDEFDEIGLKEVLKRHGEISRELRESSYRLLCSTGKECYESKEELCKDMRDMEKNALEKSGGKMTLYRSRVASAVLQLKKQGLASVHQQSLSGPQFNEKCYQSLLPYVLSIEQLREESYPLRDPTLPGVMAVVHYSQEYKFNRKINVLLAASKKERRYCIDCSSEYDLRKDLTQPRAMDKCKYHKFRPTYEKIGDSRTLVHRCCYTNVPCTSRDYHISENYEFLYPFAAVETQKEPIPENVPNIIGLDCEMVYTELGAKVARVSIVDIDGNKVYDELIRPQYPIIDYVTEYSGLSASDFAKPGIKTLSQIQKELLKIIKADTIIIGHSLENDLRALKIIHRTCVDTAVTFKGHRISTKPSLKKLAAEHLQERIQEDEGGHDSVVDAYTAVRLMRKQIGLPA